MWYSHQLNDHLVQCHTRNIGAEMIVGVFDEGVRPRIDRVHDVGLPAEVLHETLDGVELEEIV